MCTVLDDSGTTGSHILDADELDISDSEHLTEEDVNGSTATAVENSYLHSFRVAI